MAIFGLPIAAHPTGAMSTQNRERYEIIERLDAGGMAEVYRGCAVSLEGFEKQVAIKRVLPSFARNERFIKMFLDEARLSLHLNHANIVSVFDLAHSGETYFIVMEYVDGANLKRIIDAARQRDGAMPVQLAVYLTTKVCEGLQYAHDCQDGRGRPLSIVHRDVSPPNVLISWQGEIKLTDFGLAKAASQAELTDPGVVKGKFGYLSPEAALGETVDHRTDIFAAGIILWEMLAGRRLFLGKSDRETLDAVRKAEIPSLRELNPRVAPALEALVNRALARDRMSRYQSAREFGTDLTQYLFSAGLSVTSYDLAAYLRSVLGAPKEDGPRDRSAAATSRIQEEINRLIRAQADAEPTSTGRALEDPTQWDVYTSDHTAVQEGGAAISAHYASRGGDAEAVVATGRARVRTTGAGRSVAGPVETPPPVRPGHTPAPTSPRPTSVPTQGSAVSAVSYSGSAPSQVSTPNGAVSRGSVSNASRSPTPQPLSAAHTPAPLVEPALPVEQAEAPQWKLYVLAGLILGLSGLLGWLVFLRE